MAGTYTLYSMQSSGNCYKPRLLMHLLGIDFRLVDVDTFSGETRRAEYMALNPNGRVPLLVLPDGRRLSESNAMLLYLGEQTRYVPNDRYERALCHQWLFFEQYEHEPTIAVARSWLKIYPSRIGKATPEQIAAWQKGGNHALGVMEKRLAGNDWLVGANYTVADIALYAYTHVAGEGGFDLGPYPGIGAWLARVASQPGHVALDWRP
ncbi:MAG TPA: glutathione S-transferase family protein [Bauldia sp.]|nr:glutathione S-transferase family protein [Bauldia sp.]